MRKLLALALLSTIVIISSCSSPQELVYFNNIQDTTLKAGSAGTEIKIQPDDILSITVSSLNPEATAIFNAPQDSKSTVGAGYLVAENGTIQFPVLGHVKASGITKPQLAEMLTKELTDKKLLVDPIVTIRFINFKISVLGEVSKPGVYTIPNEKITLLEALSFAGDITMYGKRDNLLLVRESENGNKIIKRLNLSSSDIFNSPYYYLQTNDVVYVEPAKSKVAKERSATLLPIIFSALSLAVITVTAFAN
jgi:polysaccharide export outer membrane protein